MIFVIKSINSVPELTACYLNDAGEAADPSTSITARVYPANSDTEILPETAMTKKDSEVGFYKYDWDASGVTAGNYVAFFKIVDAGKTIITKEDILIADTL